MLVRISRSKLDPHQLFGIVVAESDFLICLQREVDFELDGYIFIRKRDITSRSQETESLKYQERLMRKEGRWKPPTNFAKQLPIGNWHELLLSLVGKPVLIENERTEDCWIGILKSSASSSAKIHCFDVMGVLDDDTVTISLRSITAVQFGDRYTSIRSKYLSVKP